jgi:hypothetical protein
MEPFSSSDFAVLEDVDGLGELSGFPGAAAEFAQDAPGFQLGVGAPGPRSLAWARLAAFCDSGLFRPL